MAYLNGEEILFSPQIKIGATMTVDQEYNPQSENPQSGVAVSEAMQQAVNTAKSNANASYANALKGSVVGNPVVISDLSPVSTSIRLKTYSPSGTVLMYGKNLLQAGRNGSMVVDGVNFDKYSNGEVYVHGTPTAKAKYNILYFNWNEWELPPGKYTFSGCPDGGAAETWHMEFAARDLNGNVIVSGRDFGNGFTFTTTTAIGEIYCRIVLGVKLKGTQVDKRFYPMLAAGTDTDFEKSLAPKEYKVIGSKYTTIDLADAGTKTFVTKEPSGYSITIEYNRDINKVIDNLTQAILSTGGNV